MTRFSQLLAISLLTLSFFNGLHAAKAGVIASQEIGLLIAAVEQSDCTFERNGKSYTAQEGADHLRLKLKRGGKYADTAEHFITRLASKSSWSGKAYHIVTPDGSKQPMQVWLEAELAKIRKEADS